MISVNEVIIADEEVAREVQHHPASSREEAERQAATALILRELLLQRAAERRIPGPDEDQRIFDLIEQEVVVPEPTVGRDRPLLSPQWPSVHLGCGISGSAHFLSGTRFGRGCEHQGPGER